MGRETQPLWLMPAVDIFKKVRYQREQPKFFRFLFIFEVLQSVLSLQGP
jgi:hypothetical protein